MSTSDRRLWNCLSRSKYGLTERLAVCIADSKAQAIGLATTMFYEELKTYPADCQAWELDPLTVLQGFPGTLDFSDSEPCTIGGGVGSSRVGFTRSRDTVVVFAAFRSADMNAAVRHLRAGGMAHSDAAKLIKLVLEPMSDTDVPEFWRIAQDDNA